MDKTLQTLRVDYKGQPFQDAHFPQNPMELFSTWLQEAIDAKVPEPNAMVLATHGPDGFPEARVVLLKRLSYKENAAPEHFSFFTSYASNKGKSIEANPHVGLTFYWPTLERQVRVKGIVEKVPDAFSDAYFNQRPRNAKITVHVTQQSQPLANKKILLDAYQAFDEAHPAPEALQRPSTWGGYAVTPHEIEFWQGSPARLHDRLLYKRLNAKLIGTDPSSKRPWGAPIRLYP
jgi:pyridoxamine 5'-phosphate oxidase